MTTAITTSAIAARLSSALIEFGADADDVTLDASFEQLDVDSLDLVELSQIVKDEYDVEIKGDDMPRLKTLRDVVELVAARAGV